MRDHEAHPADDARERHGGGGDEGGAHDDREAQLRHVQAQRARLVLGERQQVDAPAQEDERHEADRDEGQGHGEVRRERPAEAPQQPEGDGGELVVGIGHVLHQRDPGAEERAHDHAREDEREDGVAPAHPRTHGDHERDRGEPAGEGEALDGDDGQRPEDGEARAQRAARGDAEDVGRDEGILEEVLVGRARRRQRRAHDEGRDEARRPHLQDHGLDVPREPALASRERGPQRARHVARRHGKAADGKAPRHQGEEHRERDREPQREARAVDDHRGATPGSARSFSICAAVGSWW